MTLFKLYCNFFLLKNKQKRVRNNYKLQANCITKLSAAN